jgi:hypothetical protein
MLKWTVLSPEESPLYRSGANTSGIMEALAVSFEILAWCMVRQQVMEMCGILL